MAMVELSVAGMTCGGCVRSVESALTRVPGVEAVAVDLERGYARVEGAALAPRPLIVAVEDAGFDAAPWPKSGPTG